MSTDTSTAAPSEVSSRPDRPDWGDMNRELLARRLRAAYLDDSPSNVDKSVWDTPRIEKRWLNVADEAIEAILESP